MQNCSTYTWASLIRVWNLKWKAYSTCTAVISVHNLIKHVFSGLNSWVICIHFKDKVGSETYLETTAVKPELDTSLHTFWWMVVLACLVVWKIKIDVHQIYICMYLERCICSWQILICIQVHDGITTTASSFLLHYLTFFFRALSLPS